MQMPRQSRHAPGAAPRYHLGAMEEPSEHALTHPAHAAEAEHEAASFFQEVRHRLIHWPSMSRPLKLITGLAIAQVVAAALIIVLGAVPAIGGHFPLVSLYVVDNQLVSTSVPVLVATIVFLLAAWGYLLGGVSHGHPAVQVIGLALFTWLTFSGWDNLTIGVGTLWITIVLVAAIWLVSGAAYLLHRRPRRADPDASSTLATAITFVLLALLVGGIYLDAYLTLKSDNAPLLFFSGLSLELSSLSVLLIPLLLMAGADLAELAELVGGRVGQLTGRRAGALAVWGVTLAVVLSVIGYQLARFHSAMGTLAVDVGVGVGAFAVVAILLMFARAAARPALHHVPQGAVALVAVISYGLAYALILVPAQNASAAAAKTLPAFSYGPFELSGPPQFHVEKPTSWETRDLSSPGKGTSVQIDGLGTGNPALVTIGAYQPTSVTPAQALTGTLLNYTSASGLWAGQSAYLDGGHTQGPFRVDDVHTVPNFGGAPYHARAWTGTVTGYTWIILAVTPDNLWSFNEAPFDHIATTFGTGPAPPAEPATSSSSGDSKGLADVERPESLTLGVLLVIALLALAATRLQVARRLTERFTTAAVFLTLVAVLAIAALPNYVIDSITGVPGHNLTPFHLEGIQTLVGLASLGWLGWIMYQRGIQRCLRPIQLVLTLNIGLQVVAWLYDLYAQSQGVPNFTVAQAVILLAAFMVDILLSGEAITNRHGAIFPRHSRVHLYFGYVLLTVAVVLYFSSLRYQSTGAAVASQFESEAYPQTGLIQFGVPLLFTTFLLGLWRWRASRTDDVQAQPQPASATGEPA